KFPRQCLDVARSTPGVVTAAPLYFENIRSYWKRQKTAGGPPIRVIAFEPHSGAIMLPEIVAQSSALVQTDTVLLDSKSKDDFGGVGVGESVEINGRAVKIA